MKLLIKTLPFLFVLCSNAQQGNNWTFQDGFGINFGRQKDSMLFTAGWHYWARSPQTISNCKGELMLYATNNVLWNSRHQRLKDTLRDDAYLNLIIPKPGDDSAFYYIRTSTSNGAKDYLHYHEVNLRLDSGRGNIDTVFHIITDSCGGMYFAGFTKHANDTDYWLLFKPNTNDAWAFKVTAKGIDTVPIKSSFWGTGNADQNPYIRFSNNGKMVIATNTNGGLPPYSSARVYLYDFENKTGLCSNQRMLMSYKYNQGSQKQARSGFTFSASDSFIYCQYGCNIVLQFETYANNIPLSCDTIINQPNYAPCAYGMQLAPDNRIYLTFATKNNALNSLGVIEFPDRKGKACNLIPSGFSVSPYATWDLTASIFPCYNFPIKRINNKFNVSGTDGCGYDTARFTFDGDSAFSAAWWYFGDGDSALESPTVNAGGQKTWPGVVHQYKQPGSYYVRLACTLGPCGYRQWVGDSVHIKFKPNVSIAPTSTYTCGKNTLDLVISYRLADTVRLWLNGKDTVFAVTNSNQPSTINQTHVWQVTDMDTFAVKASNSQCSDSIGYIHSVKIDPPAAASFQTNNPASCGSSTFTFSDTSQLDNIVVKRTWALRQAQSDTAITTSQNQLNLTLTDTGKYTVTLTQTTRQGCVDSLTKTDFVWVHPLPEPVVLVDGKMVNGVKWVNKCFGDTALLSVIPANAGILRYQWSNGDTTQTLRVTKPGTFSVKVWDEWNCYATSEPVQLKWLPELKVTLYKTNDSLLAKPNRAVVTYEWFRNSQLITGNSQSFLYHPDSGTYQIIVTDSNGCTATSNYQKFYWIGFTPLSSGEGTGVRLFPNPASNTLYVTLSQVEGLPNQSTFKAEVISIEGKTLISETLSGNSLNLTPLNAGMYFLRITPANGNPLLARFVKQ